MPRPRKCGARLSSRCLCGFLGGTRQIVFVVHNLPNGWWTETLVEAMSTWRLVNVVTVGVISTSGGGVKYHQLFCAFLSFLKANVQPTLLHGLYHQIHVVFLCPLHSTWAPVLFKQSTPTKHPTSHVEAPTCPWSASQSSPASSRIAPWALPSQAELQHGTQRATGRGKQIALFWTLSTCGWCPRF